MSLEKILCEELNHCSNCGARCLSVIIIEGSPFCNAICYTQWKWRKSKDNVGKAAPKTTSPQRSMKKLSELVEKGFQTDGNQRDPPRFLVEKEEVER